MHYDDEDWHFMFYVVLCLPASVTLHPAIPCLCVHLLPFLSVANYIYPCPVYLTD